MDQIGTHATKHHSTVDSLITHTPSGTFSDLSIPSNGTPQVRSKRGMDYKGVDCTKNGRSRLLRHRAKAAMLQLPLVDNQSCRRLIYIKFHIFTT
jgi:hypothetical protein